MMNGTTPNNNELILNSSIWFVRFYTDEQQQLIEGNITKMWRVLIICNGSAHCCQIMGKHGAFILFLETINVRSGILMLSMQQASADDRSKM